MQEQCCLTLVKKLLRDWYNAVFRLSQGTCKILFAYFKRTRRASRFKSVRQVKMLAGWPFTDSH